MTAKRYILDEGLIYDNGKEMEDVVDVLNEYAEKNEKLKELIKEKCPLCGCDLAHYYKVKGKLEDLE